MSLIVQKFGGSSVANAERVMNVASIVTDTYAKGNDVVVVVSAQGDTTDDLIEKANEINPKASKREKDMLLAAGEQISISLLAQLIRERLRTLRSFRKSLMTKCLSLLHSVLRFLTTVRLKWLKNIISSLKCFQV